VSALRQRRLLLAGAAAWSVSTLFSAMKPVLITRYGEELGTPAAWAALVAAVPFLGIAAASPLFGALRIRASVRTLGITVGGLLVLLELASAAVFDHVALVIALQALAGLCCGLLMGATSRVVAVSPEAETAFGIVDMVAVALMSAMIAGTGFAVQQGGLVGAYLFAAATAAVLALLVAQYPETPVLRHHHDSSLPPLVIAPRAVVVVLMGVAFVSFSGLGFAFMFTLALGHGLGYDSAGRSIGVLLLLSASGCLAGGMACARFGPTRPLALAFITCGAGWWLAIHAGSGAAFFAGLVPAIFALQFCFPVLIALAGQLDAHGRWAAIATPAITSGFAWAAILAGLVAGRWGVPALATACAAGMAACLAMLWYVAPGRRRSPPLQPA
jgi:MFS family permease